MHSETIPALSPYKFPECVIVPSRDFRQMEVIMGFFGDLPAKCDVEGNIHVHTQFIGGHHE